MNLMWRSSKRMDDTEYTITPVSVEVDEDLFETVGYKIEEN